MKNFTAITEQNFSEFEQKSILLERKAARNNLIYCIYIPIQHILTALTVFFFGYSLLYEFYIADYSALYNETKILVDLTALYHKALEFFQRYKIPNILSILLFVVAGFLLILIVKALIAIIASIIHIKKAALLNGSSTEKKSREILKRYEKFRIHPAIKSLVNFLAAMGFIIGGLFAVFTIWVGFHTPKEEVIPETILGVIVVAVLCVVVLAYLFHIILRLTHFTDSTTSDIEETKKLLQKYINKCESERKAERERKKEEERKRKEAEAKKEREAKKRQQLKENLEKADEMFKALQDDDKADIQKLTEIAALGHQEATLLLASLCFNESNSELRTKKEQNTFLETMHASLTILDYYDNHSPETKLLYIISSIRLCKFEEFATVRKALNDLRKIKESKALPEEYWEVCDMTIKVLVDLVNEFEKPKSKYTPQPTSTWSPKTEEPLDLESVIWRDFRTGEQLYRNKKTGEIVNAKGEEVSPAWWE